MIVTIVLTLFLYFIFQAGLDKSSSQLPDFSWLSTRNMSVFVRPEENTALVQPSPSPCSDVTNIRLLIAVFSAPRNSLARATVRYSDKKFNLQLIFYNFFDRKTWGKKFKDFPGVKMIFMLGRDLDSVTHVSQFI